MSFERVDGRANNFTAHAHGVRLLACYENVFSDSSNRLDLYGAFRLFHKDIIGDHFEIQQVILFTENAVFFFLDGTQLVIEEGRATLNFKIRVHALFLGMIQAQLKTVS